MHWQTIVTGLLFIVMYNLGEWSERRSARKKEQKKFPYDWSCPEPKCTFRVRASDYTIVDELKVNHEYHHLRKTL